MKTNKIKLLEVIVDKVSDVTWGPSGSVRFQVNDKEVEVIVHGCGELDFEAFRVVDFEGDYESLSDEEVEALMDAFNSSDEVNKNFPSSQYH